MSAPYRAGGSAGDRWGSTLLGGILLIVVTGVVTFFLSGVYYGVGTTTPASSGPSQTPSQPVHLYQTVSFNPYSGHDQYYPANFTVPSSLAVNFTIASYDNGTNYPPLGANMVIGTQGGTEFIQGGAPGTPQGAVSTIPPNDTAHTFTINSNGLHVNVVVPPTANTSYPVRVTFSIVFPSPGTYKWFCQAPCDPYSMVTPGYMTGTITVE